MNTEDFEKLLQLLLNKVKIVAHEKIAPYKEEAYNLIKHIDPDDTLFIACCLAHNDSVLWSDDKQLKKQDRIRIIDTKDMINLIEKSGT